MPDNEPMSFRPSHRAPVPGLLALLLLLTSSSSAGATELRVLMSWSPAYIGVPKVAERFATKVGESSHGRLTFSFTDPGSIPASEQFTPVALGIFDILYTHGSLHTEHTTLGLALDAIEADPAALRASGVWAAADRHYSALGLKLLAMPVSSGGYQLFLRTPLDGACDLGGRRIRATPPFFGFLAALGAVPGELPLEQARRALEHGELDGTLWPAVGALYYRWDELHSHFLRPTFGAVTHLLLMNLASWNALEPADQTLLLAAGAELEEKSYRRFRKYANQEENAFKLRGLQTTSPCAATAADLGRQFSAHLWDYAIERGGAPLQEVRGLARAAGLTP